MVEAPFVSEKGRTVFPTEERLLQFPGKGRGAILQGLQRDLEEKPRGRYSIRGASSSA